MRRALAVIGLAALSALDTGGGLAAEAPRLTISVSRQGGQVLVDFIDNGTGIPEESQAVIFEKFSRLGDHQKAGGAGLGLAICREVMVKLGGAISYLPGQGGAAFRVSLPAGAA